jgi:hypothetical protein
MSRPLQLKEIVNTSVATAAAPIPAGGGFAPTVITQGMPTGDLCIYEWFIRAYGTIVLTTAAAGTVAANGSEIFIRGITLQTDKHGKVMDTIDGLGLFRMNQFRYGTAPFDVNVGAATTTAGANFETNLVMPMANGSSLPEYIRPYDSLLDLARARPTVIVSTGAPTDLITGGTYTVETVGPYNIELQARILNGPMVEPGDPLGRVSELPEWMAHWEMIRYNITAAATGLRIALPYGDRIYRRIYISQRLSSTFAEVNNTVIGSTGLVGIEVNSFPWGDRIQNAGLQSFNKQNFQVETMPNGWTVLDFDDTGRYSDFLSVLDRNNGTCNLIVDVLAPATPSLWIYLESYKPIPDGALRASQIAARAAAAASKAA